MPRRSWLCATVFVTLAAVCLAACTDPLPEAPDPGERATQPQAAHSRQERVAEAEPPVATANSEAQAQPTALRWSAHPARQPWGVITAASWRLADANLRAMASAIRLEAAWCARDPATQELRERLERDGEAAAFESLLHSPSPGMLEWMQVVFAETVRARDVPMTEMPQVRLIPRLDLRRWGCILDAAPAWVERWGSLELSVGEELLQSLGWRHPDMTIAVDRQFNQLYYAGWYEDREHAPGRIVLVTDGPLAGRAVETLSHEIVHALQDQETDWGLHQMYWSLPTTDQRSAFRWVFEGDASATELTLDHDELHALTQQFEWDRDSEIQWTTIHNARRARAAIHWYGLGSAYVEGAELLGGLHRRHGWSMVNSLLSDPPDSTEQLLHLDKFSADEQPIALSDLAQLQARLLTPDRWQEPRTDRMGESWLQSFIHTSARDADRASAAADGWGGDELALWRRHDDPQRPLITWQIAWDNETEHQEGVEGLTAWLVAQSSGEARWARGHRILGWDGAATVVRLVDSGQSAWLIVAGRVDLADRVALSVLTLPAQSYWRS